MEETSIANLLGEALVTQHVTIGIGGFGSNISRRRKLLTRKNGNSHKGNKGNEGDRTKKNGRRMADGKWQRDDGKWQRRSAKGTGVVDRPSGGDSR